MAEFVRSNGDNSLEMHDVVHQGNEGYVPEAAANMVCDIHDEPQVPSFGNTRLPQEEMGTGHQTQVCITSVSSKGSNHEMCASMHQSASQQNFFGHSYYISVSSTLAEDLSPSDCDDEERHETQCQLEDTMLNPITFHAEMMGDIMNFHQSLKQLHASNFVQVVAK